MILEWDNPWQLIPSVNYANTAPGLGPLPFNSLISVGTYPLGYLMLDPAKCVAGAARRLTRNNLAQANGEITHRKFKSGYVIELTCQLWETLDPGMPACAGALRELADVIAGYLEACSNDDAQLIWQPSGWPVDPLTGAPLGPLPNPRLLDRARAMGPSGNDASGASFVSVIQEKDGPLTDVTFAFLSPLPYTTDYMNWPTSPDEVFDFALGADGSGTVVNAGNVPYQPVLRIYGASLASGLSVDGFTLTNNSAVDETGSPLQIVYDQNNPGGFPISPGFWIEIDTFRSTVQMKNASGTNTANAKSGINVLQTDFFQLEPGNNDLHLHWHGPNPGLRAEVIYRNAWA